MRPTTHPFARPVVLAVLVAVAVLGAARPLHAQSDCHATPLDRAVNVRAGPGATHDVLTVLAEGERLPVAGTNPSGDWLAVAVPDAATGSPVEGWIAAGIVRLAGACDDLPTAEHPLEPPEFHALMDVPVLPEIDAARLRAVFERGAENGLDPRAFTKVGDCNTASEHFLAAFDRDRYDLGPYTDLQPTIDYFAGWFEHQSLAGQIGFNALTTLEPLWADPELCEPGEGLLACEYRRVRPAVAVMMFGPNDMLNLSPEQFEAALRQVVALSLDEGIIPVLTTFTWHHDTRWTQALILNMIVVDVAREFDIPLINFWRAAQALPNRGLVREYTHLTSDGADGYQIAFTGAEATSGYTLRNLLTLQTLDRLRRAVLVRDP